jgi:hypothetical protein
MAPPPEVLFGRTYTLADGSQMRFRLAGPGDGPGVADLLGRADQTLSELDLARLLRSDPRALVVVCATALLAGRETVLGFAAAPARTGALTGERSLVVVDPERAEELRGLLTQALASRLRSAHRAA